MQMILIWLAEFVFSVAVGVSLLYFFFLTSSPHVSGTVVAPATSAKKSSVEAETVHWLLCIQRWLAATVLGGGYVDCAQWSSRVAMYTDRWISDRRSVVTVEEMTFGQGWDTPKGYAKDSNQRQLPLPSVSSIRSRVYAVSPTVQDVKREFLCSLHYCDASFHLRLNCDVPLLHGLPASIKIPANVLSLKSLIDVRELTIHADLCVRLCGSRAEVFFPSAPLLDSKILAFPSSGGRRSGSLHSHAPMEAKAGELLRNAVRIALESLVFPCVLVLTVHRQPPCFRWERETLDANSP